VADQGTVKGEYYADIIRKLQDVGEMGELFYFYYTQRVIHATTRDAYINKLCALWKILEPAVKGREDMEMLEEFKSFEPFVLNPRSLQRDMVKLGKLEPLLRRVVAKLISYGSG
jgi:hypothetical protein